MTVPGFGGAATATAGTTININKRSVADVGTQQNAGFYLTGNFDVSMNIGSIGTAGSKTLTGA